MDVHTYTHAAILWLFVREYSGGPVPEDTILGFKRCGEDNAIDVVGKVSQAVVIRTDDKYDLTHR